MVLCTKSEASRRLSNGARWWSVKVSLCIVIIRAGFRLESHIVSMVVILAVRVKIMGEDKERGRAFAQFIQTLNRAFGNLRA